jgi:hypothetical protein
MPQPHPHFLPSGQVVGMVKFKDLNELVTFLRSNGFKEIADNVELFMDLHPCSDSVVAFEVNMFNVKPKVYAIAMIDIDKWVEELTSDNPA